MWYSGISSTAIAGSERSIVGSRKCAGRSSVETTTNPAPTKHAILSTEQKLSQKLRLYLRPSKVRTHVFVEFPRALILDLDLQAHPWRAKALRHLQDPPQQLPPRTLTRATNRVKHNRGEGWPAGRRTAPW